VTAHCCMLFSVMVRVRIRLNVWLHVSGYAHAFAQHSTVIVTLPDAERPSLTMRLITGTTERRDEDRDVPVTQPARKRNLNS